MRTVVVASRQTLSDVAIQVYGDIQGVGALMEANKISATADLAVGTVLQCPDTVYDRYMQDYVTKRSIRPATAVMNEE